MTQGMSFFKLDIADFEKGTHGLNNEQVGAYLRILMAIYDKLAPLDDSDETISLVLHARKDKAQRLVSELVAKKKLTVANGKISNDRAEKEIAAYLRTCKQNAKNGSSPKINSRKKRETPTNSMFDLADRMRLASYKNQESNTDDSESSSPPENDAPPDRSYLLDTLNRTTPGAAYQSHAQRLRRR